jgi:hypothetical protein
MKRPKKVIRKLPLHSVAVYVMKRPKKIISTPNKYVDSLRGLHEFVPQTFMYLILLLIINVNKYYAW